MRLWLTLTGYLTKAARLASPLGSSDRDIEYRDTAGQNCLYFAL